MSLLAENMESMRFFLRMSRPEERGLNGQRTLKVEEMRSLVMGYQAEAGENSQKKPSMVGSSDKDLQITG